MDLNNKALEYITNLYSRGKEAINDVSLKAFFSADQRLNGLLSGIVVGQQVQQKDSGAEDSALVDPANIANTLVDKYGDEGLTAVAFLTGLGVMISSLRKMKYEDTPVQTTKAIAGAALMIGITYYTAMVERGYSH